MKEYNTLVLCLSHFNGGMELDAIKMTKGLNQNNTSALLVCKKNSFISSVAKKQQVSFEEINFKFKLSFKIIFNLRKIIKKYNIKNIVFLGTSEIKSIYFTLLGMNNINLIVRYGTTRKRSKKDSLHKIFYSRVNTHLSISKHLNKNVEEIIPVSKKSKLKTIYTSTIFQKYNPRKIKNKAIHIGRIVEGKGQLDAVKAIAGTDIKLDLVGSIEDRNYQKKIIDEVNKNKLIEQVSFIGFNENPQNLLSESSFFIFPSSGEGLSNALIEALGHGLICIVYNNTVFPEFELLGFHLHLVNNEEQLKNRINYLIENYDKEIAQSFKNVSLARDVFSFEKEFLEIKKILV